MKYVLYSIKDKKLGTFLNPFVSISEKKTFVDIARAIDENKIPFFKDMELWQLGLWDDELGFIEFKQDYICQLLEFVKGRSDEVRNPLQEK